MIVGSDLDLVDLDVAFGFRTVHAYGEIARRPETDITGRGAELAVLYVVFEIIGIHVLVALEIFEPHDAVEVEFKSFARIGDGFAVIDGFLCVVDEFELEPMEFAVVP